MVHMKVLACKHSLASLAYKKVHSQPVVCIQAQTVCMMTLGGYNLIQVYKQVRMAYKTILVDYKKIRLVCIQWEACMQALLPVYRIVEVSLQVLYM